MSKSKCYIGIRNEAKTNTLELHFTDFIYDDMDWKTWEVSNMVQETIDKIKDAAPSKIKIIVNSLGGDVMIGLALYNYLKNYNAEKEVEIIGFAASISSVIPMCADKGKLKMAKNAFMIIHPASSGAYGNASDLRAQAEALDKVSGQIADIYAQRSGKDSKHFTNLWKDGDYWMTGEEAKKEGLVDELFNAEPMAASVNFEGHNFKNIPAQFAASVKPEAPSDPKNFFQNIKDQFMSLVADMKAAIKGGKEDKKFENVANRDAILDMVESILSPIVAKIDEKINDETTDGGGEEVKPAEVKPEEVKPAAETKDTENKDTSTPSAKEAELEAQVKNMAKQIEDLKAAVAGSGSKPAVDPDQYAASLEGVEITYKS